MMDLKQPRWTLEDAYGHVDDFRFQTELTRLEHKLHNLQLLADQNSDSVNEQLKSYLCLRDEIEETISSLKEFCKCCVSFNIEDTNAASYASKLGQLSVKFEVVSAGFETRLLLLSEESLANLLECDSIRHWMFSIQEKRGDWKQKLSSTEKLLFQKLTVSNLVPLGNIYTQLANSMKLEVTDNTGQQKTINNAGAISILKGAGDAKLRETAFAAQNACIDGSKELYGNTLNAMAGFRLHWFEQAGVDRLTPSTQQNRMSNDTLDAMITALKSHRQLAQKAVQLRAPYFGHEAMKVCDLLAPAPDLFGESSSRFTFPEAIDTLKESLGALDQEWPDFIDMMVEKKWIEASLSEKKIGGAFYTRFNRLKQPRVFTSFVGTLASVTQQAHELGHAWHYWIMRDLPVLQTEFPMTLTETASTFNENQVRDYLLKKASTKAERFTMLWQELKTISNFLLNIPVRYEFEQRFLEERAQGAVSTQRITEIMELSWREWYGDSTIDADRYFWASKLHFFKADQYIYNYPYSFGYLFSIGLLMKKEEMGDDFFPFYKELLRDTGRMTVEALFEKHMGVDSTQPEFWNQSIGYLARKVELFEKEFAFNR